MCPKTDELIKAKIPTIWVFRLFIKRNCIQNKYILYKQRKKKTKRVTLFTILIFHQYFQKSISNRLHL